MNHTSGPLTTGASPVYVTASEWNGQVFCHIRHYYYDDSVYKPSKKGVAFKPADLETVMNHFNRVANGQSEQEEIRIAAGYKVIIAHRVWKGDERIDVREWRHVRNEDIATESGAVIPMRHTAAVYQALADLYREVVRGVLEPAAFGQTTPAQAETPVAAHVPAPKQPAAKTAQPSLFDTVSVTDNRFAQVEL